MARLSLVLKLEKNGESSPEGVSVFAAQNRWNSPPGGWLPHQAGVWNQSPAGIHLMEPQNQVHVAECRGLNFYTSAAGDSGEALYPLDGGIGRWTLIDTTSS